MSLYMIMFVSVYMFIFWIYLPCMRENMQPLSFRAWLTSLNAAVRMAIFDSSNNSKCWQGCGKTGNFLHYWWKCKLVQPLWKAVW
jgi:hypothetical protein